MINHARTLLLNRRPAPIGATAGEELVSPYFIPGEIVGPAKKIRDLIFGGDPDRLMLNYRLAQLMPCWHDTELVEFVLAMDTRITYWPVRQPQLFMDAFRVNVVSINHGGGQLTPIGELIPDEARGQLTYQWRVDVTSSSTVRVRSLLAPHRDETQNYTVSEDRSSVCRLVGSSLQFNFTGPVGSSWYVNAAGKPRFSMGDILASLRELVTAADDRVLFGSNPTGPEATWLALWREHPHYAYQLGGLLLGVASYIDKNRL